MLPKRKIGELVTLYKQEPTLHDVFVEGSVDSRVISIFVESSQLAAVVKRIDLIEVDDSLLSDLGLPSGNRSRVIALMKELARLLGEDQGSATGVIDRDFDQILEQDSSSRSLRYTDFTDMEMYFYDIRLIKRVFLGLGASVQVADQFWSDFYSIGRILFSLRFALAQIGNGLPWISATRSCRTEGNSNSIVLDRAGHGRKLAQHSEEVWKEVDAAARAVLHVFPEDRRACCNGHDFIEIAWWYLCATRNKGGIAKSEGLLGAFVASVSPDDLDGYELFRALRSRLGGPSIAP